MKIIYVDIDGPLILTSDSERVSTKWHPKLHRMNQKCVSVLNEIILETDCDLIVSSQWKNSFSHHELGEIFEWNGIIKKPIDITDDSAVSFSNYALNRCHQIAISVEKHHPEKWVAIDDLPLDVKITKSNFVYCDPIDGLCGKGVKEMIIQNLK